MPGSISSLSSSGSFGIPNLCSTPRPSYCISLHPVWTLQWWTSWDNLSGVSPPNSDFVLYIDTALRDWGAYCNALHTQGHWLVTEFLSHQLPRTFGCFPGLDLLPTISEEPHSAGCHRQRGSHVLYKQTRRDCVLLITFHFGHGSVELVQSTPRSPNDGASFGSDQH